MSGRRSAPPAARNRPLRTLFAAYGELEVCAARLLRRHGGRSALQPRHLVHESMVGLIDSGTVLREDRSVVPLCATVMRRVLADQARRRRTESDTLQQKVEEASVAETPSALADLEVEEELENLSALDSDMSRAVELRIYAGRGVGETARAVHLSKRTFERRWARTMHYLSQRF